MSGFPFPAGLPAVLLRFFAPIHLRWRSGFLYDSLAHGLGFLTYKNSLGKRRLRPRGERLGALIERRKRKNL